MRLKRLRDITNKRMVFVKGPTGQECQVWVDETTNKMYYYDRAQWVEYEQSSANDGKTYGSTWQTVDGDDDMGVYDTNNPTDLFTWESGDEVSYIFKDWDGTVLKEGKVNEGTAPTAPADPTRESTAEYTYTFTGWNPTVAPITKKTTYTAQYEATPRNYTVTIGVSPEGAGTVDTQQVTVAYGTEISSSDNVLTIGSSTITATAGSGYNFSSWGTLPATVTEALTITATFESPIETLYSGANGTIIHDKEAGTITYTYTGETTAELTTGDTMTIADKNIGATSYDIHSPDSQGYCYQWGNNYGFPNTGALQTSQARVDAGDYTASTYSSDVFITNAFWDLSKNDDLWGGITGTDVAKKGPCPNGYHIPSSTEMSNLIKLVMGIMNLQSQYLFDGYTYMLVPILYDLNRTDGSQKTRGGIWACDAGTRNPGEDGYYMSFEGQDNAILEGYRCKGNQIRPFKNASI